MSNGKSVSGIKDGEYRNRFMFYFVNTFTSAWLAGRKGANTRVIILDWAKLANPLKDPSTWFDDPRKYTEAAENALDVGASLGKCLAGLVRKGYEFQIKVEFVVMCIFSLDQNKIHLVGHSLGAHLVGKAGREFSKQTRRQKVGRVTGEIKWFYCRSL